jgi:ATP-dependent Clp protease ATP-binding subunit ClpC
MENFTPRAQQVLALAKKEAEGLNHNYIGTEHLLLGLIRLGQGVAVSVLQNMGLDLDLVRKEVENQVGKSSSPNKSHNIPYTPRVKKVLALAGKEAKALKHTYIGTEHILLGLMRESEGVAAKVLESLNLNLDKIKKEIMKEIDPNFDSYKDSESGSTSTGGWSEQPTSSTTNKKEVKTPSLQMFGKDLTEAARKGEFDPVVGRENEIERVIQVLCRRTKNNPVLIGEAGVGKTAIAEGLAQEIVNGTVPGILSNKRIVSLDLALMVAGTKYRGQFEERIKAVMDEVKKAKNVILFIDELHNIVGAGSAEGAMDASNIIKPALSRGEIQCIGATTLNEYRKFIEKDSALERRFQQVKVEAPSVEQTIKILKGLRPKYEAHHKARYSDEALIAAAKLSDRYLTGRFLPDKAIDIMDEAGARARIGAMHKPESVKMLEEEIETFKVQKETAIQKQKYEEAALFRDKEKNARISLERIVSDWKSAEKETEVEVNEDGVMYVVSKWTGVPLNRMEKKEAEKLLHMEDEIKDKVIGQKEAVIAVSKALRRSRADLKDPRRPIGSFVFLGPTGVGKTFLAQTLAEYMFGDRDALIQIDMSEYMEKHNVSRLIGSPPGYIGHEEGGQLSEAVRRRPYCVILFDEIEKAHPDVLHLMLQIMEEGKLTDSLGRKIDFRNTIIIMTSNVGAEAFASNKKATSMGFGAPAPTATGDYETTKSSVLEEAKKTFKPEFINRLDEIVVFHSLGKDELLTIVNLEVKKLTDRLKSRNITVTLDTTATDLLIEKGYEPQYGARPMRRAVEKYLEDPLAEELLKGALSDGDTAVAQYKDQTMIFVKTAKQEEAVVAVEAKPKKTRKKKGE